MTIPSYVDLNLVPVRIEVAVGRLEPCQKSVSQIKPEPEGVGILEQAMRSAGINAGDKISEQCTRTQRDRYSDTGITSCVRMSARERKLCIPTIRRTVILPRVGDVSAVAGPLRRREPLR